jgi:putative hydrolase of the HAD superfamily
MDAILLDVGGVLLVPHAEPVSGALGVPVTLAQAERAHYEGTRALDACPHDLAGERQAYLHAYVSSLGLGAEAVEPLGRVFAGSNLELWRQPVSGSTEALKVLAQDHQLAIVSNADGTVEEQLRRGQICQVGEGLGVPVLAIIDSHVVGVAKPAAEIFRHAIEPLGVTAEQAVYVGDTVRYDVAGARAAGIRPIHFDPYTLCPDRGDHQHIAALLELSQPR